MMIITNNYRINYLIFIILKKLYYFYMLIIPFAPPPLGKNLFKVTYGKVHHTLQANDEHDKRMWLNSLRLVIEEAGGGKASEGGTGEGGAGEGGAGEGGTGEHNISGTPVSQAAGEDDHEREGGGDCKLRTDEENGVHCGAQTDDEIVGDEVMEDVVVEEDKKSAEECVVKDEHQHHHHQQQKQQQHVEDNKMNQCRLGRAPIAVIADHLDNTIDEEEDEDAAENMTFGIGKACSRTSSRASVDSALCQADFGPPTAKPIRLPCDDLEDVSRLSKTGGRAGINPESRGRRGCRDPDQLPAEDVMVQLQVNVEEDDNDKDDGVCDL